MCEKIKKVLAETLQGNGPRPEMKQRRFDRLARYGAAALVGSVCFAAAPAGAADPIKIGSIFDLTGDLNIYGIQQSRALHLAVDKINETGGLLGRKVEIVETDAQSQQAKYTQYANTLVMRDNISALFAGLTSSAREAIRPIVRRANVPYFYSSLYEGGACDKQTFVTGPSASQQLSVLIPWAIKSYGRRLFIMAPDYNFGTISAEWIKKFAAENNAEVVGSDILPLTVTDYSPTLQKIQLAKPDVVVALPVGANQTGFLEQFAAAGLKQKIAWYPPIMDPATSRSPFRLMPHATSLCRLNTCR
jgi:branched-chain amino acid transport system substrate-binding protein